MAEWLADCIVTCVGTGCACPSVEDMAMDEKAIVLVEENPVEVYTAPHLEHMRVVWDGINLFLEDDDGNRIIVGEVHDGND